MAVENSKVGPIEELAQSWQDEIEGRVKGLQTGSYARILKMAKKPSKQEFRQTVIGYLLPEFRNSRKLFSKEGLDIGSWESTRDC